MQAGAGLRDTVHLVLTHESGAASTVTLSHTVAPMSTGIEFFVHGDAGRLVLLPETGSAVEAFRTAVDELTAAAVTGGVHPCDVAFGRDVVAVLETAASGRWSPAAGSPSPADGQGAVCGTLGRRTMTESSIVVSVCCT